MSDQIIPLAGTLKRSADGSFTLTLTGNAGTPIPPNPTDPRPVKVFNATGGNDTAALQNWVTAQPNDAIYDIKGVAAVDRLIRFTNKRNVKVTSSNGGGFRAVSNMDPNQGFASMVIGEGFTDSAFDGLKFNCNGKQAMGAFVFQSTRPKVLNCEVWNIARNPNGAPWAGIYGEQNTEAEVGNCNVHDTDQEVRGIWLGVGSRLDVRPHIHHNVTRHTGHSGIIAEADGPNVHHNQVFDIYAHGTGYKFIARGGSDAVFDDNLVDGTLVGAGIMVEGSGVFPKIYIRRMTGKNCGPVGSTFGLLYVAGSAGTKNIELSGCSLDGCKSIGAAQYADSFKLTNNQVVNGPAVFHLELNCTNFQLQGSGKADIGQGCSNVWVDGQKVA